MVYTLTDFSGDINALFAGASPVYSDCEPAFKKILASPDIFTKINKELANAAADPLYLSRSLQENNLIVAQGKAWTLVFTLYEHVPAHLYSLPLSGFVAPIALNTFEYDTYDLPKAYVNDIFDRSLKLENKRHHVARPGDVVHLSGDRTVFDLNLNAPVGVLKFLMPSTDRLQWTFDRHTLLPIQAISATAIGTELAYMAQVLGIFKHQAAVGNLQRLAQTHPHHHVRWEAVKAIAKINPETGLEAVKAALSDEHPHIVMAATRTLARHAANSK